MDDSISDVVRALSGTILEQQRLIEQQYALIQKLSAGKAGATEAQLREAEKLTQLRNLGRDVDAAVGLPGRN